MDGVTAAATGAIAGAAIVLGRRAIVDIPTTLIAVGTLAALVYAKRIPEPLIQEKLNGEGQGVFLFVWDGELKSAFCHRRLREKPPSGGVSVYRESIPLDHNLVDKSFALLQALRWNGVAMVEFKVDARDGVPKLMEVNGRFWGSLQLAVDAGINFPLLLYRLACGEEVPAQFDYKAGVKSRWLLGDLDHLLIRLTHRNTGNGVPVNAELRAVCDLFFLAGSGCPRRATKLRDH